MQRRPGPARVTAIVALMLASTLALPAAWASATPQQLSVAMPTAQLEPASGTYFGAYVKPMTGTSKADAQAAVTNRENYFGRKLDVDHWYYNWESNFIGWRQAWDFQNGRIPMISWSRGYSSQIIAGAYDDMIRARADGVKSLGKPIFLRWAWEPDGKRWIEKSGTPAQYIAAWRHIHDIFETRGATNAVWIWCPTAYSFKTGTAWEWYPGDAYVDWIATDGYNWYPQKQTPRDTWRSFVQIFDAFYQSASPKGKPLMLGEYGVQEDTPGRKADWVHDAQNVIKTQYPAIKAIVYFDTKTNNPDRPSFDWRMDTSASAYAAFKDMATDPHFNPGRPSGDTTPPTAPTNLTAKASSSTQVDLNWTAATDNVGVTAYNVYRDGVFLASAGNATAYSDTSAAASTTYTYTVKAKDAAGNLSAASNAATVTTLGATGDTTPPSAPTLSLTGVTSSKVDLSWTASTDNVGVVGYNIYRDNVFLGSTGSTTTYSDTTVMPSTTYVYTVKAKDAADNKSDASNAVTANTPAAADSTAPTAPAELNATAASSAQVNLTWTASTDNVGVTGYDIYRGSVVIASVGVTTSYSDTTVQPSTSYTYKVKAKDAAGNVSAASNLATVSTPAAPTSDTTAPSAPTGLLATAASSTRVDLSWTAASDDVGVTAYDVYRGTTLVGSTGGTTTYADTTVAASTSYTYTVKARDAANNVSAASNTASVTTPAAAQGVFTDGFETGNMSKWTANKGVVVEGTHTYSGAWAARAKSAGGIKYARKVLGTELSQVYYRARFKVVSQGVNVLSLIKVMSKGGKWIAGLFVKGGGQLCYRNDLTGATTLSSVVAAKGAWHTVQMRVLINGTASQVEVWLDGARVDALSRTDSLGTTPVGQIQIGEANSGRTYDVAFDDVAVDSSFIG